jgi:O-antigen ligase
MAFWSARAMFETGGVRRTAHRIAWIGLAVSVMSIVERAISPTALYGVWPVAGARPYGPFINRNHMATWLIIAMPLTAGAFAMRVRHSLTVRRDRRSRVLDAFADPTLLWLAASAAIMLVALVVSASRSGAIGIAAGLVAGCVLAAPRLGRGERRWLVIAPAAACVAVAWYAGAEPLANRFLHVAASSSVDRRVEIWRQTLPIVRDFAATGTGAGTYYTAMLVYQSGDRLFFFNQAHNHYLQIAAEGGILGSVPRVLMLAAFAVLAWRRLRADRSEMFWLRAGALASVIAVAAQSMWETGLVMPANGILCAAVAAIAVHQGLDRAPNGS